MRFAHELRDGMDVDLQMGRLVHLRFNLVLRVFKALWPAAGRQERLGGTGILLPQDFCGETNCASRYRAANQKNFKIKFQFPRVSPGTHLLTKTPEDSGYEIGVDCKCSRELWVCKAVACG